MAGSRRTPAVYRRDLWLARGQVIRQLRDQALESGNPFDVDGRSLDAAAFDACGMAWIGWIAISGM